MSKLSNFIAFKAVIELVKKDDQGDELFKEIYQDCLAQQNKPASEMKNYVKQIYDRYTDEKISEKIAELYRKMCLGAN